MIRACVAAGHGVTAEAGAEILRAGGNAVDAAVAATCMSFIAEPVLTGAGGGGFMLICQPNNSPLLLDGFARMPKTAAGNKTALDFQAIPVDFGDNVQTFHIGRASVATPGLMSMLFAAHERFGRIPMREVISPACHAARHGVTLNSLQASFLHLLQPILSSSDACLSLHGRKGRLLESGERFCNPALANLLELLCVEGIDEMYHGDVARSIVDACRPGGMLAMQDMAEAQALLRQPLHTSALNGMLLSNPPPSSGGPLITFSLHILEALRARRREEDAILLAESLREAAMARNADFDRNIHQPGFADGFLLPERIGRHVQEVCDRLDGKSSSDVMECANRHGSTTHISTLDADGMAVSLTASNGEGSGVVAPGTGIHLNNMLGEEDINPLGFHRLAGGETLSSMMAPSILVRDKRPALILGSGGSNRLRGAILQVLFCHALLGKPIKEAVQAPRLHPEGNLLEAEPGTLTEADRDALRRLGWQIRDWSQPSIYFGGVHAISIGANGKVEAAGDPRRGGAVAWA